MNFIFTGFNQSNAVRQFAFDCIGEDRSRSRVTVDADLMLARKHKILLQDLPLLCLRLLQKSEEGSTPVSMTFTEDNMVAVRTAAATGAAKSRVGRRPTPDVDGQALPQDDNRTPPE